MFVYKSLPLMLLQITFRPESLVANRTFEGLRVHMDTLVSEKKKRKSSNRRVAFSLGVFMVCIFQATINTKHK